MLVEGALGGGLMSAEGITLRDRTVAIVGLGLMGGSLALALQERDVVRQIIAVDTNADTRARAQARGIPVYDALDAIVNADLIILATPVRVIVELLPRVGEHAAQGAVIMDLGSVMREIVSEMEQLPLHVDAISGHPMCGKETSGFSYADANLFNNKVFVLTPLTRTREHTIALVSSLVSAIKAQPLLLDAERHDRIVAAISHLPYAIAAALILTADEFAREEDMLFTLASSGFRDTSRLASSDAKMMLDILLSNSQNIAQAMRSYSSNFAHLAALVEKRDEPTLRRLLERADARRSELAWARLGTHQ